MKRKGIIIFSYLYTMEKNGTEQGNAGYCLHLTAEKTEHFGLHLTLKP